MYACTKTLEEALKERAAIESEMLYALVSTEHLTSCQEIVLAGPKSRKKCLFVPWRLQFGLNPTETLLESNSIIEFS